MNNMSVSFTACTQKPRPTEASIAFQQDSIFIVTCWNHLCANKTGNLFKEKILLKIVSALIFYLALFPLFTSEDNKKVCLFTSGDNKKVYLFTSGENKNKTILHVNVMLFSNQASCSRKFDFCSPGCIMFFPLFFLTQQTINIIWHRKRKLHYDVFS